MPMELLSLIGGSATGFLFRYMAEKRAAEQENFKRLIEKFTMTEKSMEAASKRVPIDVGKGVRQFIVLMVLFGTIVAPFVLPFFGIPTLVEINQTHPEMLFGLVPETTETIFQTINGYLFTTENRQILLSIVS